MNQRPFLKMPRGSNSRFVVSIPRAIVINGKSYSAGSSIQADVSQHHTIELSNSLAFEVIEIRFQTTEDVSNLCVGSMVRVETPYASPGLPKFYVACVAEIHRQYLPVFYARVKLQIVNSFDQVAEYFDVDPEWLDE